MTKNPERKAQTKTNLTDAFWSLYKKYKIENISVKDITELAGYNRSTFYEYFLAPLCPYYFEALQVIGDLRRIFVFLVTFRSYKAVILGQSKGFDRI